MKIKKTTLVLCLAGLLLFTLLAILPARDPVLAGALQQTCDTCHDTISEETASGDSAGLACDHCHARILIDSERQAFTDRK